MKGASLPIYNIEKFKPPGNEDGFYVCRLKTHLKLHEFVLIPHRHDFFFVAVFTKGSGQHFIDFRKYNIIPGCVYMLSPGQLHSWILSDDIDGYIFFHTKDFFEMNSAYQKVEDYPFFCSIYNCPFLQLDQKQLKKIRRIFKEIIKEERSEALMRFNRLFLLVQLVYIDLVRLYLPIEHIITQNQDYLMKIRKLEDLISENFRSIKSPNQYAEMMFVSVKQLNRICKECLNKSTSDLIMDRIMLETKRLLVHSSCQISEISEEMGYTDISYFSRLFKKKCGKTPLEFTKAYAALYG